MATLEDAVLADPERIRDAVDGEWLDGPTPAGAIVLDYTRPPEQLDLLR